MGDRVYAAITFGGHIETVVDIEDFIAAIVVERVKDHEGNFLSNREKVGAYIRACVENKEQPTVHDEEVNYGAFEKLERMVDGIELLGCLTEFQSGGGFDAGTKTIMPNGDEYDGHSHREGGAMVAIEDVIAVREAEDPIAALNKLIEDVSLASGGKLPLFTVSVTVESWLNIFMEPS